MGPRGLRPGVEFGIDAGLVSFGQADARIEEPTDGVPGCGALLGLGYSTRLSLVVRVLITPASLRLWQFWCAVGLFIVVSANAQRRDRGTADSGILTTKTRRHEGTQRKSSCLFLVSLSPCLLVSLSPCLVFRSDSRRDTCTTKNRDTCTTKEQYTCTTQGEGPRCDWQTGCRGV
jgi:hypothetical protein